MKDNEYTDQLGSLFEEETAAEVQDTAPSPSPKKEESTAAVQQIDTISLIGALNRNGHAKLSDHAIKDKAEKPESKPEETPAVQETAEEPKGSETAPEPAKSEESGSEARPAKKSKKDVKAEAAKKEEEQLIATDGMAAYLKGFLDKSAAENPEFAKVYANPKKSLKECVEYVCSEVFKDFHKAGICTVRNDAIEGKALHYYQEEDAKPEIPQGKNIAMAVLLQGMPIPAEDFEKIQAIARKEQRKDIIEEEKKKYAEQVRSGKVKIKLTDEEQAEIDAAGRQALVDASAERQKKNTSRKSQAKPKDDTTEEQPTLF